MLRSCFGKLTIIVIGPPVTIMSSNADLEYLMREQIDKVRESIGSSSLLLSTRFVTADSSTEMGEYVLVADRCGVMS